MLYYQQLPVWKRACSFGRDVQRMTQGRDGAIVNTLRDAGGNLPVLIAMAAADGCGRAGSVRDLHIAFHHALDIEFYLAAALDFDVLSRKDGVALFHRMQPITRRLFDYLNPIGEPAQP